MNILDLPATMQLGKMWRRQSKTECSTERKISSVPVLKQDLQKTGKCFTVIKELYSKYNNKDWNFSINS